MAELKWLSGDCPGYVFAPISVETFTRTFFGRTPLYVRGNREKFAGLLSVAAFERAMYTKDDVRGKEAELKVSYAKGDDIGDPVLPMVIRPQPVDVMLRQTSTICFSFIHRHDPNVRRLVSMFRSQLGYPGEVGANAYLSSDGAGFASHFDARVVTTLQLSGSKRWRFSKRPALSWPRDNAIRLAGGRFRFQERDGARQEDDSSDTGPDLEKLGPEDFDEVLLEPGDVLVLPAGTWHSARAKGVSLATNLYMEPFNYADVLSTLIARHFEGVAPWHGVPPLLPSSLKGNRAGQQEYVEYVRQRLAEAQRFLSDIDPLGSELIDAWASSVLRPIEHEMPPPPIRSDVAAQPADGAVKPGESFRLVSGHVYCVALPDGSLTVYIGDRQVTVGSDSASFVSRLLEARSFVAKEAASWAPNGATYSWEEVAETLRLLETSGVIERAPSADSE